MTATAIVRRDGIIYGMPDVEYHVGPELSSTGAKRLLQAPARFKWALTHKELKDEFDVGHAAHAKVLGFGLDVDVIPAEKLGSNGSISTNAAKKFVEESRAAGRVPLKQEVVDRVDQMAEAILAHGEARMLLEQAGDPEASVFATDPDTGVRLRGRFDFLPNFTQPNPWCVDLKTIGTSADAESFSKQVASMGYDVQEAHYLHTLGCATGDFSARMKFIVVETDPPHLVAVHQLSDEYAEIGAARARRARQLFAECTRTDTWPGYPSDVLPLQPPLWHVAQNMELTQQ